MNNNRRITVHLTSKDRPTEVYGFLISLKFQTHKEWDIILLDDGSSTPLFQHYFIIRILDQLREKGHKIKLLRNDISYKVCKARNKIIDNDDYGNPFVFRGDDDTILEPDVLERLLKGIDDGFDMVSGIIPNLGDPLWKRETKHVKPIVSEIKLNDEGVPTYIGDDCGYGYVESELIPTHHFRTYFLYKSEIQQKIRYEGGVSQTGYREEAFFSIRAMTLGYKLAVDTGCVIWHLRTPSGGCRDANYNELLIANEEKFHLWMKRWKERYGDVIKQYNEKVIQ